MKQKLTANIGAAQSGFTLVEMLAVIGIMGLVASIFIANFAAFRGPRNLRIATNELVTNLRKIQSYTLSSRNSPSGLAVKYYILKVSNLAGNNTSYQVQSINSNYSFSSNIETLKFPEGIIVRANAGSPKGLQLEQPIGAGAEDKSCVQIAFSLPFSRVYLDGACSIDGFLNSPIRNPNNHVTWANSKLTIVLMDTATNTTSTIIINGITGAICVPTPSNSC